MSICVLILIETKSVLFECITISKSAVFGHTRGEAVMYCIIIVLVFYTFIFSNTFQYMYYH